jgi:hypothetical protein
MNIWSPILLLGLPSCLFPSSILTIILYEILTAAIRATIPVQLTIFTAVTDYRNSTETRYAVETKEWNITGINYSYLNPPYAIKA